MKGKTFKTTDELLDTLVERNVYIGSREQASRFLLSYGYYSVVNGYKKPLLDLKRTNELGEDYYRDGTMFADFQVLYLFDALLRLTARNALDVAETIMKTASVYAFNSYNSETQAYLDPSSYISAKEYYDKGNYTRNLIRLLGVLQSARDNKNLRKEYIQHHIDKYREVPLWVISQTLTFGNMSAFYDLQRLEVQNAVCRNIEMATEKGLNSLGAKTLRRDYKILTGFRNICSHGERFYCARIGNRKQYGFSDLLLAMQHVLPTEHFSDFLAQILEQLNTFSGRPEIKEIVLNGLGMNEDQIRSQLSAAN